MNRLQFGKPFGAPFGEPREAPLAERMRPTDLDEIAGQGTI